MQGVRERDAAAPAGPGDAALTGRRCPREALPAGGRADRRRGALLLAAAVLASGCVGPVLGLYPPRPGEAVRSVWVVNHGWHTGIVVRRQDVPGGLWPQLRDFADSELVEVGWGDRDFYMAPAGTSGMTLKAALRPGPSVLHVVGFSGPVEHYFAAGEIVELKLSAPGFARLAAFVGDAYAKDEAGAVVRLGPGQYPNSRFYLARETYHALKTCNTWTAKALRAAGCPITPLYALTAGNVMYQAAAFCGGATAGPPPGPASNGVDAQRARVLAIVSVRSGS